MVKTSSLLWRTWVKRPTDGRTIRRRVPGLKLFCCCCCRCCWKGVVNPQDGRATEGSRKRRAAASAQLFSGWPGEPSAGWPGGPSAGWAGQPGARRPRESSPRWPPTGRGGADSDGRWGPPGAALRRPRKLPAPLQTQEVFRVEGKYFSFLPKCVWYQF